MKYLIDTHVLLWITNDDSRLSEKVKNLFLNEKNDIYLSMASVWEMAIKISLNKLDVNETLKSFVRTKIIRNKIKIVNISVEHLFMLENLPFHHKDPFDRL
ncbi:MAG: type II toxin-antitoxin system VapC family toxin [Melioribacteraceae bacterium]